MKEPEIIPIEIRPGEFVRIAGIPHDLTRNEAEKIARVILAYAPPQGDEGAGEGR